MNSPQDKNGAPVAPETPLTLINESLSVYSNPNPTFKELAQPWAARGFKVIPVARGAKRPVWLDWPRISETETIDQMQARCNSDRRYSRWNCGLMADPEFHCALDCDDLGLVDEIERETGRKIPDTMTVRSAGKGCPHFYFKPTPRSRELKSRSAITSENRSFDFWVWHRQTLAPGSVNDATGKRYELVRDVPMVPIPDWLCDWIEKQHRKTSDASGDPDAGALAQLKAAYLRNLDPADMYDLEGLSIDNCQHPTIHSLACYIWDGKRDESEMVEILETVWNTYCSREYEQSSSEGGLSEIDRIVQNVMEKEPCLPGKSAGTPIFGNGSKPSAAEFKLPRVDGGDFDFVVNPLPGSDDGWFPRGDVSLFAAPSGGGKTTVVLDLLATQLRGEEVFGHTTNRLPYLVLLQDRGMRALRRTLKRLRIDPDRLPHQLIGYGDKVKAVTEAIEAASPMPAVVFIEGIDLLEGDSGKGQNVEALLSRLYRVADHYHVAIVGSTGCPKMKPKDTYTSQRDRVIGSSVWGRKVETIVTLAREHGKETDDITMMTVLPRNAKVEEFRLEFKDGRLVEAPPVVEHVAQELSPEAFVKGRGKFSRAQLQRAMGWSKNKTCDWIGAELGATLRRGGKHPDFFYEALPWEVPAENVGG